MSGVNSRDEDMAKVYSLEGIIPVIDPSAFVHPEAVLIGDVIVGPGCYIGPCASLRGDFGRIRVGRGVNIQDTCVIHSFPEVDCIIEEDGHIGHGSVIHGCVIKRNVLVGMTAVIMDGAMIGENSFVAASSFVKAGMQVPPNMLVAGIPARIMRELSKEELEWKATSTRLYQRLAVRCMERMEPAEPLRKEEPNRGRVLASRAEQVPLNIRKSGKMILSD
jgi:phenylacetic acid degradation protein